MKEVSKDTLVFLVTLLFVLSLINVVLAFQSMVPEGSDTGYGQVGVYVLPPAGQAAETAAVGELPSTVGK